MCCKRKLLNLQNHVIIVIGGLNDQSLCDRIPGGSEVLCWGHASGAEYGRIILIQIPRFK